MPVRPLACSCAFYLNVLQSAKRVTVAFKLQKLQIMCVIVDDLVSVEDLQEKIQEFEDYVQSTDIAAFNKL